MSQTWEFTDLEFNLLCEDVRRGELPAPFIFTSRTRLEADYEREKSQVREQLRHRLDHDLDVLASAIAKPDVFVVAHAWNDQDFANPAARIRVHAIRHRARGYVITQRPGETLAHSAGFDAVECDPYSLADTVIGLLPRCGAGKLADIALSLPDTAPTQERDRPVSSIADDDDDDDLGNDHVRSAGFFATPALSTGIIKVLQGRSKYGARGRIETGLLWRDLPDDGRYVIPLDDPAPVASAMSSDRLALWTRDRIEEILTRMESHSETEE
ncbi:ESX secretion-associated protein EspG [Nocardia alba]|uniref:ESAT-6 protein secretion system EspG family protein n=1 Tax=Nocardia alba TaxID=225051 RepID=A0A4R1FSA9_9NOCA|nr:ESX secretion-associated protein EspG [Nocardia alba]TCJ97140.1 ESAT-6 protein secretion system EspG family protein [Nocardia alba]